jgi:hypothetical protein
MRASIERAELIDQLNAVRRRAGLGDETRLETHAPLLVRIADEIAEQVDEARGFPGAIRLLENALRSLAPESRRIARASLNLDRRDDWLNKRLEAVARAQHVDKRVVEDRARGLQPVIADLVLEELRVTQARRTHERLAAGDGSSDAERAVAAALLVESFQYYYRVFTPAGAVGNDLSAYLIRQAKHPAGPAPRELLEALLHHYAEWLWELERFVRDLGGNWIASEPDAESTLVNTLDAAQRRLPFSDRDGSILMKALLRTEHGLQIEFEGELSRGSVLGRFRKRLQTWAASCRCNPRRPRRSCEPHEVVALLTQFTVTVEREWYRLSSWYQIPPDTVSAERDDVAPFHLTHGESSYDLAVLDAPFEREDG